MTMTRDVKVVFLGASRYAIFVCNLLVSTGKTTLIDRLTGVKTQNADEQIARKMCVPGQEDLILQVLECSVAY